MPIGSDGAKAASLQGCRAVYKHRPIILVSAIMASFKMVLPLEFRRPSSTQGSADAIPILVDSTYHLFHLTTPHDTVHHPERLRSSWSRLRSEDLVHWRRDDRPDITPGIEPTEYDADGVWTGSAILGPDGNMHVFYTGYNLSQDGKQMIIQATSSDKEGTEFTKAPVPIVISEETRPNLLFLEDIDFRDPYVLFNEDEQQYWMLVASRLAQGPHWTRGCIALLKSRYLDVWHLEPDPLFAPNDMICPECPELFTLPNGKWYLVYSRFASPHAGTVYRVSDSPRGPFRKPADGSGGRWDGRRWYAAKSCPKAGDPTQRIYFGWIADRCAADKKWMWGGDMAFPRQVSANSDGCLEIQPVQEVLTAAFQREPLFQIPLITLKSYGSVKTQQLDRILTQGDIRDGSFQLLSFKVSVTRDTASFGILLHTDSDIAGYWLRFSPVHVGPETTLFIITLSRLPPSLDDFWADQYKLYLPRDIDGPELVRHDNLTVNSEDTVRILMIEDTVEVFVGGRAMSYRFDQDVVCSKQKQARDRYGLFVDDGEVTFRELCAFNSS